MRVRTRSVAALLACFTYASPAVAQSPSALNPRAQRQQERADAQAQRRAARGVNRGGTAEVSELFSRTVRLVPGGTFDLQNVAGDVTITGGGGPEARIEATKRVRGFPEGRAQALLNEVQIVIAERGGNVEVRTVHPRVGLAVVDYVVTLPANANVVLRSASGNLRVQRMSGDEFTLSTLRGNVELRDLTARMLDLHTVTGNALLQDIAAQRALLQSMAGNLEYAGLLARTGRYQFQTHGGNIRVIPSGNPGFDLEAMTYSGDLKSDFVLKMLQRPRPGLQRPQAQRVLRGTFGDAGALLTASSFSGNIVIIKP